MSFITHCPACQTTFRVVSDQLKLSQGWVRCGQCNQVFDAASSLQDFGTVNFSGSAPPSTAPAEAVQGFDSPSGPAEDQPLPAGSGDAELVTSALSAGEVAAHLEPDIQLTGPTQRVDPTVPIDPAARIQSAMAMESTADARFSDYVSDFRVDPEMAAPAAATASTRYTAHSFLDRPQRESRWHGAFARLGLWTLLLSLGLVLALQLLHHERDRLAAAHPGLKPVLESLCVWMHCRLEPLQQIDAILIESSSFNQLRPDVYQLNLVLKNRSSIPVALPALELSLTDGQDQPVLRRVIQSPELGLDVNQLSAHGDVTITLSLALQPTQPEQRVAGYRVLAFYP